MKKIAVVTSTRADYGYLRTLISLIKQNNDLELKLIATGTHVDERYGETVSELIKDGNTPDYNIAIIDNDTPQGILNTMSNAISKVGEVLNEIKPDIVVLLGDRYEIFAIASACVILNIPIAHLSGGDVTFGAVDDMFRHSITKMSNIHFAGCESSKNRIIQMGESPKKVFNVGEPSIEVLKNTKLLSKEELENELGIDIERTLLTTFHPVTLEKDSQNNQLTEVLEALVSQNEYFTLLTRPNADTLSTELNNIIDSYAEKYPEKIKVVTSLGVVRYMSVMKYCRAVVGNSSSGITEAPSFKLPTINIGNRQKGRFQAESTINCPAQKDKILEALKNMPTREDLKNLVNPYEKENTSLIILEKIIEYLNSKKVLKEFYDIKV